jgi:hypothetical protein
MLVNRYQTVYLSIISTDLPIWNVIEASASLYQRDQERFHLLLHQQNLPDTVSPSVSEQDHTNQGLFWLEISPHRVMMTMQSNGRLSYRHFWEKGVEGASRYYLSGCVEQPIKSIRLRNFTRYLRVENDLYPRSVRIEYEIWSAQVQLGSYVFHLNVGI